MTEQVISVEQTFWEGAVDFVRGPDLRNASGPRRSCGVARMHSDAFMTLRECLMQKRYATWHSLRQDLDDDKLLANMVAPPTFPLLPLLFNSSVHDHVNLTFCYRNKGL